MATEVGMPRLGWDMQVGNVAEWLKHDGEPVAVGEPICMIAGDKATVELEAPESGILRISPRAPGEGVEVPVGTVLAYVVAPGEALPVEADEAAPGVEVALPRLATGGVAPVQAGSVARGERGQLVVATPRARRAAAGLGVDWRGLTGSGRGGRILERDVAQAAGRPRDAAGQAGETTRAAAGFGAVAGALATDDDAASVGGGSLSALPLEGIRRLTAERMALSARTVAPVTLTTEADASELVRLRERALAERLPSASKAEERSTGGVPGYTDLLVKVVGLALVEHPALNAELTETGIVRHAHVHIALAVDTPRGLVAPVIHDVTALSLEGIARESSRLIDGARSGTSRPEDLRGATFTITNLGMYDVDAFTPIVNLPQCAILGLGRIVARPVVVDEATEQIAVRRMLSLSLTFDHRLVDGAPAARFLQRIKHLVERPTLWLFR